MATDSALELPDVAEDLNGLPNEDDPVIAAYQDDLRGSYTVLQKLSMEIQTLEEDIRRRQMEFKAKREQFLGDFRVVVHTRDKLRERKARRRERLRTAGTEGAERQRGENSTSTTAI